MNNPKEWDSILQATQGIDIAAILPLTETGIVAYADGACLTNPGGPAGWAVLLWADQDNMGGHALAGAPCVECYGHIAASSTATNIRSEITSVLAALHLAPLALPLTIYSDSEFTIKAGQGEYRLKKNLDLWQIYRELVDKRKEPPTFVWVAGHSGHLHNERADELAGLGAFNGDRVAHRKWRDAQKR